MGAPQCSDHWITLVATTAVVDMLLNDPHICGLYELCPLPIPTPSCPWPVFLSQSYNGLPPPYSCRPFRVSPKSLTICAPYPYLQCNRSASALYEVQGTPSLHPTILQQRRDFLQCQYTHTFAMSNAAVRPVSTHKHVVVHNL